MNIFVEACGNFPTKFNNITMFNYSAPREFETKKKTTNGREHEKTK
jgi:hypothetical protein